MQRDRHLPTFRRNLLLPSIVLIWSRQVCPKRPIYIYIYITSLRDDTSQDPTVHSRDRCDCVLLPPLCVLVTFLSGIRTYPVHCQASRQRRFLLPALHR